MTRLQIWSLILAPVSEELKFKVWCSTQKLHKLSHLKLFVNLNHTSSLKTKNKKKQQPQISVTAKSHPVAFTEESQMKQHINTLEICLVDPVKQIEMMAYILEQATCKTLNMIQANANL